jgi:small subunit ribosomal protein S16
LRRAGKKKQPFYRIVAAEASSPVGGKFIEVVGWYDPLRGENPYRIDREKALRWLRNGAEPSGTVRSLLAKDGLLLESGQGGSETESTPQQD